MKSLIVLMDLYEHCEEVTRNATLPSGQLSSLFLPNLAGFESADLLRNNIWRENSNISATLPFLHRRHLILGSFANKQKSQILLGEKFPLDKMVTNLRCQLCVAMSWDNKHLQYVFLTNTHFKWQEHYYVKLCTLTSCWLPF